MSILRLFIPNKSTTPWSEKILSAILVFLSIEIIVLLSQLFYIYDLTHSKLILASIGASAILVFGVPHGKLSQPWRVIGSHLIAATVGITTVSFISDLVMFRLGIIKKRYQMILLFLISNSNTKLSFCFLYQME